MIGRTLAHYRILEKLGKGGMGVVYRAEDLQLGRHVALKLLPEETALDPDRLARFEREARTLAALNHPNIVTIYSVDRADGQRFLTMELVEGRRLTDIVPGYGLGLREFFDIALPMVAAVGAAHEAGIVHRDLKPSNVMVTDRGQTKVLDFGLAKLTGGERSPSSDSTEVSTQMLTAVGRVMGTPSFMAPEQAQGKAVDHRADLFALGVVLYQMATGIRPFRGDTSADIISSILRDEPPPVSEVRRSLPRQLGRVIARCLAKDADRRYASADALLADLQALAAGRSGSRLRLPTFRRSAAGGRGVLWGALAVVAAVAVGILLARTARAPASRPYAIAVLPLANLSGDPGLDHVSLGIGSGLITGLSEVAGLRVVSRAETWSATGGSPEVSGIARRLGVNALVEGDLQREAERIVVALRLSDGDSAQVLWSERFDSDLESIFSLQERIVRRLTSVLSIPLSPRERRRLARDPTRSFQAYDLYLKGQQRLGAGATAESLAQAVELFRQAIRIDDGFALAHVGLSEAHWRNHEFHQDAASLEAAIAEAERAIELDPELPAARVALARVRRSTGRAEDSIDTLREALAGHPKPDEAQRELAWAHERAGDLAGAERALRAAVALAGESWFNWNALGTFYGRQGRYEDARDAFERAAALAPEGIHLPEENLATTDLALGRYDEAVAGFSRLPEATVRAQPRLASNFGTAYYFSDRPDRLERAAELYRTAIRLRPNWALYHRNLGDIYRDQGDRERSIERYREAARLASEALASDPDDAKLRLRRVDYQARAGDCTAALAEAGELADTLPEIGPAYHELAYVFALCDRADRALSALRRAVDLGETTETLRREPEFESLRDHPGFRRLLDPAAINP